MFLTIFFNLLPHKYNSDKIVYKGEYMKIKDLEINYIQYGNEKGKNIVLLHGWGQNTNVMDIIGKKLYKDFYITNLDFPGFGKSEMLKESLNIYQYEEILEELLSKLKIKNPILIGHSFGGRVAIIYASKNKTEKLVLLAAPFRKVYKTLPLKVRILKLLKKIPILSKYKDFFKTKIGSKDYKNSTPIMRETLVNIVNEDITENLKQIICPTLLVWGSLDTEVPIEDAKYAQTIMKDAGLVEIQGSTHFAFIEQNDKVIKILENFLEVDKSRRIK